MKNLPKAIEETFLKLKKARQIPLTVDLFNGKYYLYRRETKWDKENKRVRSTAEYLGRIRDDGLFLPKKPTNKSVLVKEPTQISTPITLDPIDEKILMNLSMNCRLPLKTISKRVGLSLNAVEHRINHLEKKFSMRYFASINYLKLGFSPYLALVKFKENKPKVEIIKEILEKEPRIQLVMTTQGNYDLLIYILAENNTILSDLIFNIRKNKQISEFDAIWDVIAFDEIYGYVPFRKAFFDVLEKKVWHRSKMTIRPASDNLKYREYILLREMGLYGDKPFAEIEKEYNLGHGAAKYTFDKLKESGLIWRQTLTMRNQNMKYNAIILMSIVNSSKFLDDRKKLLQYIIKDYDAPINRFALAGNTVSPEGITFILPVFKEGELETEMEWLGGEIRGVKLEALVGTKVIIGELCYRKFDNNHSQQFSILEKEYGTRQSIGVTTY